VAVRSETPVALEEIEPLLALRVGEPFDEERARQTLRALRLSGLAAEVELWSRAHDGGVEAIVVLRADLRVVEVSIAPVAGVDVRRLAAVPPQRAGQPLREDRVVRGVYALETALEADGWLDARARVEVDVAEATREARVIYRLEPGVRAVVGQVSFEGLDGAASEAEARDALRARPGEPLRRAQVRDDADRLQRFLVRRGFRLAEVEPAREVPRTGGGVVDLVWKVARGPEVELVLTGADRRALEKRDLLPFLGDAGYDEALLVQAVEQIRAWYQSRGHYDVAVETREERTDGRLVIHVDVEPGRRATLEEVDFEGNSAFPDERLARLLQTSPRRLLSPGSGRLVDQELNDDVSNLRSFYALSGYDRVRIGPPRVERRDDRLRLVIRIDEGLRRSVAEVSIEGRLSALDAGKLAAELPLAAGGPFHRLLLESSVDQIRSRLEEKGYRAALVSHRVEWGADGTVARVTFRVLEGERSTAGAIVVRGNTRTDARVIRRFLGLGLGDPISTAGLLDVQRRLYALGVFSRVSVGTGSVGAGATDREVLVEVEEGKTRSVAYGAGWDSESGARGLLRLAESNLGGRLITLQLDALVSQKAEVYRLLAMQPYLGRWPVDVRAQTYREFEDRTSFTVFRRGVQLALRKDFGRLTAGLAYDYRIVDLESDEPVDVIPRESRNARVASLTPSIIYDRRDDPIEPTRGWSVQGSLERAFQAFSADASFTKLFAQGTAYLPLRHLGVIALSTRGGYLLPLADPEEAGLERIDAVPAAELYYAGGRTTHRAFERDLLGIPGETLKVEPDKDPVPLGGGLLALVNLEWRFPIAGPVGGEVFVDGGNLWREAADFDARQARWGAGVGVRYLSPIGPLRAEIGWKLEREPWESPYVWFVSLGNPF
jgi:outer membrane protein insertion porin family